MTDELIIVDGGTFVYSDSRGDIEAEEAEGFFYKDVRHLSRWHVVIDGHPIEPLTTKQVNYFSARIMGSTDTGDAPPLAIRRDRFVSEGFHEDFVVENLEHEPRGVLVEVRYGSDFNDVLECQTGTTAEGRRWTERKARSLTLWHERDGYRRGTGIAFNRQGRVFGDRTVFRLTLPPRQTWSLCIDVTPVVEGKRHPPLLRCASFHEHAPKMPLSLDEWLACAPEIVTENRSLERTYRQSLLDLAALRMRPDNVHVKWAMPGGGLPWFMTVFGRDSLIAAYEAIPFHAELAQATLEALAELQATEWDNWRDAEPGKIMHELRRGTLAALGKIPHTPYYGTHDATLLWLILLDEYERWSGDSEFVRRMEPNARAALAWMEGPGDLDGDGYLEYRKRSDSDYALDNHCWKDSKDSIRFPDGRIAEPPIATCEIQGYAYDARLRTARLMREVWDDPETAGRLERGILRRLMREDVFSGWGVRTMSSRDRGFNPLLYHCGTVWPHDTAIVAEGMRRYGFRDQAAVLCKGLLDAAAAFGNQLPEVFAGFSRDDTSVPVEYPSALKPQSWAAAAPLLAIRTLLGLDVVRGSLRSRPHLPERMQKLELRRVRLRGTETSTRR